MCGIVASISDQPILDFLLEGIKRLEYRGYDSAGVALLTPSSGSSDASKMDLFVDKHVGKVANLTKSIEGKRDACCMATTGIAHTRWATHGPPNDINAHPHCSSGLAVIHNGIIENHESLRNALKQKGYKFISDTDTEVIAHLIRHIQSLYDTGENEGLKLEQAVCLALSKLEGAYGLCVIDKDSPDVLIGARKGSPLILGESEDGLMLASDAAAIVGKSSKVLYLMEDDVVVCKRNVKSGEGEKRYTYEVFNLEAEKLKHAFDRFSSISENDSNPIDQKSFGDIRKIKPPKQVKRAMLDLTMTLDKLEKGGHEHFMLKEILEQPSVLRDCMRGRVKPEGNIKMDGVMQFKEQFKDAKRLIICGCGTSYHSGLIGEYLIESLARIPVEVEYASEFRYRSAVLYPEDIVIVISQSGETADTLECMKIARKNNCTVFGIVNVVGSSIARDTDAGIYLHIGPEIGVASTKAFSGQVTALCLLALNLAELRGTMKPEEISEMAEELLAIPEKIEKSLFDLTGYVKGEKLEGEKNRIQQIASTFRYATNFLYLGRGYNYPSALEGALKLKEISYIHAEGYPAAEMKHGPIALIDTLMPVIIIAPKVDKIYSKIASAIEEVHARRGNVILITTEDNTEFDEKCEFVIKIPKTKEEFTPLLVALPLQLLAYYIAKLRGCEIDHPRNLAKSVTVE